MGVLDKFLDAIKLSDDDEYEDDDFFDDEFDDDYEDERPKKSLFKKEKPVYEDEEDDYEIKKPARSNSKVTPMRQPARRNAPAMEVCVIKPNNMDDSREITETLLSGRTVILNLEGLDLEDAQRIIDFISGATFAIDGNLQKISNSIFLVTPAHVDISGDLQDLLGSSLGAPAMRNRY
ncbi:MAG: cell division protein SepF [Tyzzerella sp.]|nr:cell division protein SepF [Tyzzerella sp.]